MAYSLNPKDLREQLKTYKQPVYVASTQPAQQSVAPASTSQYRQVDLANKGADFYDGNRKISIDEYAKNTGKNVDQIRGQLAQRGSVYDQKKLQDQYYQRDPSVNRYNTLNVDQQRKTLGDLESVASRKDFRLKEDVTKSLDAKKQLAILQEYGKKKEGNFGTFLADFGQMFAKPAQDVAASVGDTFNQNSRIEQLNKLAPNLSQDEYNQAAQEVLKNSVSTRASIGDNGVVQAKPLNLLEFGQKFASEGANAAVTYLPVGSAYKNVAALGAKAAAPQVAKGIFKEGTAYTVANTGNDILAGRGVTPESLLNNALTSYGGAALGAGAAVAKPLIQQGGKAVIDAIPTPEKLTMANAEIQALTEKGTELFNRRQALLDQGLSVNSAPYKQLDNAIKTLGQEYNLTYKRVLNQSKNELQRGSIQVPGGKPDYRSTHQIDSTTARNLGDMQSVDDVVSQIKSKYGLTNYDQKDITNLKKIVGNPDADVKIYRASPINEINSGDWVTTSKEYANDIKRQNGGKVYEYTVKAKDLNLPANIEDNPSLARFSAFQYNKSSPAIRKDAGFIKVPGGKAEIPNVADVQQKITQLRKQASDELGYDNATTARRLQSEADALEATIVPQVTKTPKQPTTQKSTFEADLEAAGLKPTAQSKFARTVQRSDEVSDPLKAKVKEAQPRYDVTTDEARIAQSESYLKSQGIGKATTDIKSRLAVDKIDDQTASDAIAVAKRLDARSTTKSLQEATEIYEQLAEKFSKAGQLVQAASLLGNRTPEGLRFSAIKSLKKEGVTITPDMTKKVDGFIQEVKKTKAGSYENGLARHNLMQYVAKQLPQRKMSQILQVWKAGLLTSPRTTAGNLAANTAESILRKGYVDPLANVLDAAISLVTGQRSRKYTLRGITSGAGEGVVKGVKYFKTGYDPRNPSQKFDVRNISYSDKPLGKAAEVYTQAVFRLMGAQDQPFYYAALRNSLYDQALTEASRQKLKGSAKSDFVKQFITEPQTKAMDLADKEARYAVFQNETALGKTASRLKSTEGIGGDIAEFLVPFSGVPSSIATRMIERTPIGWATEIAKQIKAKKFDQRAMTQAIANGSMVIPLVGAGVALANSGAMTLGYPTEKKERDLWEAEGKQPYSIKVGDQWLSTNYFQPAGNLIAAGAEYQRAINDGEDPETAYGNALAGAGKAFTEQSFLKGVSGGINALTDPQRSAEKFAEQTAGSVVPNIIRTAARATDPVQREVNGIGDAITSGIPGGLPGGRQTLPAKTNIYGQEVPRRGSMIDEIINPFKPSKDLTTENRMTAALRELQDQSEGITPTQATKSTLKNADSNSLLDDKQLLELNKRVASEVSTEWSKIMEDPRYQKLSDGDKKRLLTRVNDSVYGAVKSEYGDTKLTKTQQLYKKGAAVDYFANFDVSSEGLGDTKLPSNSLASSFLLDASAVDSLEKGAWGQSETAQEYRPLIDQLNSQLPESLPKVPYTNKTAELISEFEKAKADSNWSKLELNDKTKDLAINTYKAQLTDNEQFITTLSDADIKTAAENGQISKEELDRIIAIDDITTKLGGSQMIGNKTRRLLGYGTIASKSSGGGGSGKKRNYKLNAFGDVSGQVSGNLRKLVEQATIKGV